MDRTSVDLTLVVEAVEATEVVRVLSWTGGTALVSVGFCFGALVLGRVLDEMGFFRGPDVFRERIRAAGLFVSVGETTEDDGGVGLGTEGESGPESFSLEVPFMEGVVGMAEVRAFSLSCSSKTALLFMSMELCGGCSGILGLISSSTKTPISGKSIHVRVISVFQKPETTISHHRSTPSVTSPRVCQTRPSA